MVSSTNTLTTSTAAMEWSATAAANEAAQSSTQSASVQSFRQEYECKEPSNMNVDHNEHKEDIQYVRVLDESFFREKLKNQSDGTCRLVCMAGFNIVKLITLRNWLAGFFCDRMYYIKKGKPVPQALITCLRSRPFAKDYGERLKRVLTLLRLTLTSPKEATVLFDVGQLVPKRSFLFSISQQEGTGKVIMPCKQKELPLMRTQHIGEKETSLMQLMQWRQDIPQPIKNKILSYLDLGDIFRLPQFYASLASDLKDFPQSSKEASTVWSRVLDTNHRDGIDIPLQGAPHLEWMRNGVEELSFKGSFKLIDLDQAAIFFPKIRKLSFYGYNGADSIIEHLQGFTNLERLDLNRCDVTGTTFNFLPKSLKYLSVQFCDQFSDAGLVKLSHTCLEELEVHLAPITGATFDQLPKTLKRLTAFCDLTDEACGKLSHTKLDFLEMGGPNILGTMLHLLPMTLKFLRISGCHGLIEANLKRLGQLQLVGLDLDGANIEGTSFADLPRTLRFLSCRQCRDLKDVAIHNLKDIPLEFLSIGVTGIVGEYFADLPASLEIIDFDWCENLTDEAIGKMACPKLVILDISGTHIEGTHFSKLSRTLRVVNLDQCDRLHEEAIDDLVYLGVVSFDNMDHAPRDIQRVLFDKWENILGRTR